MTWSSFFWVRSAGFPFNALDSLGMLTEHEEDFVRLGECHTALVRCEGQLLEMARELAPSSVGKLERRFATRAQLDTTELASAIRDAAAPLLEARRTHLSQLSGHEQAVREAYQRELPQLRLNIADFFRSASAREALYLSNPESLLRIDALLENDVERIDSRARQRYRLAWNYMQRLCAKNDTASFFGPIAWGKFAGESAPNIDVSMSPGPWLASRKTFFEHWVVLRLSDVICADVALRDSLPLTLNPGCDLREGVLHVPIGKTVELDPLGRQLIGMVMRAPRTLSPDAVLDGLREKGFAVDASRRMLDLMLAKGVVQAGFDIPPGSAMPMQRLHEVLTQLDAPTSATSSWLGVCERLEAARVRFECGDLDARIAALDEMRALLSDAGVDLSRVQGQMYVGRFPVYEDCARNLHVSLGGELEQSIKRGLDPVMRLYEWLTRASAVLLHDRYLAHWRSLSNADASVDFLTFLVSWQKCDTGTSIVDSLRAMLRDGWARVSARHVTDNLIELTDADFAILMETLAQSEPRASRFPISAARVHSPDFMVASSSLEAAQRGDYQIVVGEVHPAVHTVSQPVAQPFCPYSSSIRDEVQALLSPSTVIAADSPKSYQRSHIDWLDVPALRQVVLPGGGGYADHARRLRAGAASVQLRDGILVYCDRETGAEQDLLTVMPTELHCLCFALAADLIGQSEPRRLTYGRVLLKRRAWRIETGFPIIAEDPFENADHYMAWRGWAATHGLPRYVFAKCASEPKPVYVDFFNPFAVDLLAKWAKKGEPLQFSEMKPAPHDLWLTDDGGRYCCEFRTSHVLPTGHAEGQASFGEYAESAHVMFDVTSDVTSE